MDDGRTLVLIDEADGAAHAGEEAQRAADRLLQSARKRIVQRRDGRVALGGRLTERRSTRKPNLAVVRRVVLPRRIEDAVTAAEHRGGVGRVGHTHAWGHFERRWVSLLFGSAVDTGEQQPATNGAPRQCGAGLVHECVDRVRRRLIEADGLPVLDFAQTVFVLDPHAVVERELRVHSPVVLCVGAVVAREPLAFAKVVDVATTGRPRSRLELMASDTGPARKQSIEREAPAEDERPGVVGRLGRGFDPELTEITAELEAVRAHQFGERAVDGVRSCPPCAIAAPSPHIVDIVEEQLGEHRATGFVDGVDVVGAEAERAEARPNVAVSVWSLHVCQP